VGFGVVVGLDSVSAAIGFALVTVPPPLIASN
jgi:hypothetical protein